MLRHIQSDYVEDPNIDAVTNGALRGLLESLDSDSSYLTPADYKLYKQSRGRAQVGINVAKRFGYATVVSVVPGSPADKAGLADGDIIEAIGAMDTRDVSPAMIAMLLDGAPGSELTVSLVRPRRGQTPEKITMSRAVVSLPAVAETMYENSSILYLKPGILDRDHVQQIETKLKAMQKSGNKKVLLDLRDVAAGDPSEAARLANFFLRSGTIATLEGQKTPRQTIVADPAKSINVFSPIAVLVNHGTAGPAEIVAGALLDNKRADLVGEKTFGQGAQQKTFDLPDGGALILSPSPSTRRPPARRSRMKASRPACSSPLAVDETPIADEDGAAPAPMPAKPTVQVDEQLTKAIDLLKSKAA